MNTFTPAQVAQIVADARTAAQQATESYIAQNGNWDACGFAWTSIYGVKGNTKLGKMLKAAGVDQNSYERCFQIWNPSGHPTQSITAKEKGAQAAAEVFRQHGFNAHAGSRLD